MSALCKLGYPQRPVRFLLPGVCVLRGVVVCLCKVCAHRYPEQATQYTLVGSTRWLSGEKASVCGPALGVGWVAFPSFLPLSQWFWAPAPPQPWRLVPASLSVFQPWQLLPSSPLPFLLQEILLVPVRLVTEQQSVWRGRDSSQGQTVHYRPWHTPWSLTPSTPCEVPTLLKVLNPNLGIVSLRWKH